MSTWDITTIVEELKQARQDWRKSQHNFREFDGRELPSKNQVIQIAQNLCGILFPMRLGPNDLRQESEDFYIASTLEQTLYSLYEQVKLNLIYENKRTKNKDAIPEVDENAKRIVNRFANQLPQIRRILDADIIAAFEGDPAARSVDEVLLCYPGILAITYHRIAHELYRHGLSLLARLVSEAAHSKTGIDIHPGAQIGAGFFIDHGTGVVIGETTIIGERVRIYQAVTLGAKRFQVAEDGHLEKDYARHPIVEDDVVIYAGATILGRITIGKGSVIGGNVWLTHNVEANSHILQGDNQARYV
ncbi:serine O-acetyltransferase EpsC [Acinetobacter shaoyimingii]|uniref:serine O-acetyltransferase n=1 Tax=Acinetobacter shaoyimingii TaxID=2715164 RepID=A0A6G8RXL6_9GAMM|nr:serine O-acetyltransferase EpsC [Acinetobacter shaoyimingii]NHB57609.1 serine acetyltransferase [Acinetobacter shaoyimingii]QIO06686.1 serine acetyltransferase [Acinetobacter shaoyimingii]